MSAVGTMWRPACIAESQRRFSRDPDDDEVIIVTVRDPLLDEELYGAGQTVLYVARWEPASRYSTSGLYATERMARDTNYCMVAFKSYRQVFGQRADSTEPAPPPPAHDGDHGRPLNSEYAFDGHVFTLTAYDPDYVHPISTIHTTMTDDGLVLRFWLQGSANDMPPSCSGVHNLTTGVGLHVRRDAIGRMSIVVNHVCYANQLSVVRTVYNTCGHVRDEYSGIVYPLDVGPFAQPYSLVLGISGICAHSWADADKLIVERQPCDFVRERVPTATVVAPDVKPEWGAAVSVMNRVISSTAAIFYDNKTSAPTTADVGTVIDDVGNDDDTCRRRHQA